MTRLFTHRWKVTRGNAHVAKLSATAIGITGSCFRAVSVHDPGRDEDGVEICGADRGVVFPRWGYKLVNGDQ